MDKLDKTLMDVVLEIRDDLDMPKFAVGDIVTNKLASGHMTPGLMKVIGYTSEMPGIILLEVVSYSATRTEVSYPAWIAKMGIKLEPDKNYLWVSETNLDLIGVKKDD